jgi:polyisoprenoid-binding protein YceI
MRTPRHHKRLKMLLLFVIPAFVGIKPTYSLPIQQVLSQPASSISFGVDSKASALQMNGAFKDFKGLLALDPDRLERSFVQVSLNLQSAQLSPDQILQAVFLQTALARVNPPTTIFKSTSITKDRGDSYLVTGTYTWMGKSKMADVPIRIVSASPLKTEVRILLNGVLHEKNAPRELSTLAPGSAGSKGWAKAILVFLPRKG